MKYHIVTFGCAANEADSERIASYYQSRGFIQAKSIHDADHVVINTCMIREKAAHRVYGLIHNLSKLKIKNLKLKIVVTGCMVGMAVRDSSGKMLMHLKKKLPTVDEFLPIEEVGFDYAPVRTDKTHALVPITNGCNNFCTYCVVPFTRGREVSRPVSDILAECKGLAREGYTRVTLIGQNVNSYGSDLKNNTIKPVYVKHLGRLRIPTLFPYLLEEVSTIKGLKSIDFISSNPWDFSDELIDVIAQHKNISRHIHLPVQSGDNMILKRMNRWYTREEYLVLVEKLRKRILGVTISTDIIVGFCAETEAQFNNTVDLAQKVGFSKAYVAMYSDRPMTAAHNAYKDSVPFTEKKRRWEILETLINKTNLKNGTYE
jgi:tRNA-2-methylthio-N6-dimethylallyladenosine synthase